MKYIIIQVGEQELPILFAECINHVDIASAFTNKVISAGFVDSGKKAVLRASGKSEGLKILSRPQDTEIINNNLEHWWGE